MNALITGAAGSLGQALAAGLRTSHRLRLTARASLDTDLDFVRSDLGHDEATDALVAGIDVVIHQPEPAADTAADWLDACTRCTYNLLLAAAEAGVERVIHLSSLDLLRGWGEDTAPTEGWQPRPSCEPAILGPHLGEFVAREFAREGLLKLLFLRLGSVVRADETAGRPFDPMWIEPRDVVRAVAAALERDLPPYQVLHVLSASPRARFSTAGARDALGYEARHNFEDNP